MYSELSLVCRNGFTRKEKEREKKKKCSILRLLGPQVLKMDSPNEFLN